VSIRELVTDFESLGNNCEFGIVQRFFGAEPLSLLRWAGIDRIEMLINALHGRFRGLGEVENVAYELPAGWDHPAAIDRRYGFYFHTDLDASGVLQQPDELLKLKTLEGRRLKFLAAKLFVLLQTGEKVLVYLQKNAAARSEIDRLFDAIRDYGRNTLLVVIEDPSRDAGSVEVRKDGLIEAYVPHLSNSNPPRIDFEAWQRIIAEAHEIWSVARKQLSARAVYLPPFQRAMTALGFIGDAELRMRVLDPLVRQYASSIFDFSWYIGKYPDIRAALAEGLIAQEHFWRHGYYEDRLPAPFVVDEDWYLKTYGDVTALVEQGAVGSASDHYQRSGYFEGKAPNSRVYPFAQMWNEVFEINLRVSEPP